MTHIGLQLKRASARPKRNALGRKIIAIGPARHVKRKTALVNQLCSGNLLKLK